MASIFEVLGQSGRLPLDELALRSSEPADTVLKRLQELTDRGLVRVEGEVPTSSDGVGQSAGTMVELTRTGMKQVVNGL
jgi:hypothetical protein